jgi:predicted RND superfamily exporter protein
VSRIFLLIISLFFLNKIAIAKDNEFLPDNLFHIDQMNSHNKNFALYFKGRENSILARGEN